MEAQLNKDVGQGLHRALYYTEEPAIRLKLDYKAIEYARESPKQVRAFDYGRGATTTDERVEFMRLLKEYGLQPHEMKMLGDVYLDGKSISQIVEDEGYTSEGTAGYLLRKIKRKIASMGLIRRKS